MSLVLFVWVFAGQSFAAEKTGHSFAAEKVGVVGATSEAGGQHALTLVVEGQTLDWPITIRRNESGKPVAVGVDVREREAESGLTCGGIGAAESTAGHFHHRSGDGEVEAADRRLIAFAPLASPAQLWADYTVSMPGFDSDMDRDLLRLIWWIVSENPLRFSLKLSALDSCRK